MTDATARLRRLSVRDFRNLTRVELEPPRDGLVVIGDNGHGKTNFLEAIYYLEILRSARSARDQDLVRFGTEGFHLAATVDTVGTHEIDVGFERAGKRKRVRVDGAIPERLGDVLGTVPAVMFAPADVGMIAGPPAARRRYLDIVLALTSRGYLNALQRYRAALAHRNAALRQAGRTGRPKASGLEVWEASLAEHGARLWSERQRWVAQSVESFERLCGAIGEAARVTMRYATELGSTNDPRRELVAALEVKRALDIRRGITHAGPHRDDLAITIDDRDLRSFGSAGQQRTAAIALRMLEVETFRARHGSAPLFLLDDPFAELDAQRSSRIMALLDETGIGQTYLAVPRESDIPPGMSRLRRYRVVSGALEATGRN